MEFESNQMQRCPDCRIMFYGAVCLNCAVGI